MYLLEQWLSMFLWLGNPLNIFQWKQGLCVAYWVLLMTIDWRFLVTYLKLFTDPQGYPDHMLKPNENKSNLICFILSKLPTHISPVNTTKISDSFWHTVHLGLAQQMSHWDMHKLKMCSQVSLSHLNLQELVHHWYYRRASFPYQKAPEH